MKIVAQVNTFVVTIKEIAKPIMTVKVVLHVRAHVHMDFQMDINVVIILVSFLVNRYMLNNYKIKCQHTEWTMESINVKLIIMI